MAVLTTSEMPPKSALRAPPSCQSQGHVEGLLADATLLEGFRGLRRFLALPTAPSETIVIGCTAALYHEGASSIALGLSVSLAYDCAARVLLADCDFVRPTLHERLGFPPGPGLTDLLAGKVTLDQAARFSSLANLRVLSRGERKLLGVAASQVVRQWVARRRAERDVDFLILDLPPANVDLGTRNLAKIVDRTVLAVRGGVTPRDEFRLALLHLEGAKVSVVVNGTDCRIPGWLDRLARFLKGD